MSRIPYVPLDLAEPREIVDAVRARRGGVLRNLDRLLLHSPELARGWNAYLGTVRTRDATFERARNEVGDLMQVTELVATIATYNMVSRFIVAMNVEP